MFHKLPVSGNRQQFDGLQAIAAQVSPEILVILDSKVDDYTFLAANLAAGTAVAVLDETRDGVEQITALLTQYNSHPPLSQVHLICHGAPGCLYLGNSELSLGTLGQYAESVSSWFAPSQAAAPSLLLYGCNVAAGDAGSEFLEKLHGLTGAAIAASKTRTGNADQGGDWNLEVTLGNPVVELAIAPQAQAAYAGVLAPINQDDYDALKAIYDSTNGANWTGLATPWALSGNTVPELSVAQTWTGLTFNENGRVSGITLKSKNLIGTLPNNLNKLADIQTFDLEGNGISGSIPSSLGNLPNLGFLNLGGNILSGPIPDTFTGTGLPNLFALLLYGNRRTANQGSEGSTGITGPIPAGLGSITSLTELDLSNNGLTGSIPDTLGNLVNLNNLNLFANSLSGTVPASVLALPANTVNPKVTQLALNNPVSIGDPLNDRQVPQNAPPFDVSFTVSDIDAAGNSPVNEIVISEVSSSNTALVTVANTSVGNDGNRKLTITPVAGATGIATITFKLDDADSSNDFEQIRTFQVIVGDTDTRPVIQTNTLSIAEGGTVVLSAANLNTVDPNDEPSELTYTVSNIVGGQFEIVGLAGAPVTSFTQQQINASQIRFVHNGGELAPSYTAVVKDNDSPPNTTSTTAPKAVVAATFTGVNDAPTAVNLTPVGTVPLPANANLEVPVTVASIAIVDPDAATSTNTLTLAGTNAALFQVVNGSTAGSKVLQLQQGVAVTPGTTYTVAVNVDDPTIGQPGDIEATRNFELTVGPNAFIPTVSDDSNGDRISDIVFRNPATSGQALSLSSATANTANTAASFGPAIRDANWEIQAVGKFNRGTVADYVWRNKATGQNVLWLGDGFQAGNVLVGSAVELTPVTNRNWKIKGAGDFNDDGFSDLLWYNQTANQLAVWYTNATDAATPETRASITVGSEAAGLTLEATGDFNGDGDWDLLWSNATGAMSIWAIEGVQLRKEGPVPVLGGANPQPLNKPTGFYVAGTGNFDSGATSDIAFVSTDGASTKTWLMQSNLVASELSATTPTGLSGVAVI